MIQLSIKATLTLLVLYSGFFKGQSLSDFADSVRQKYRIPELAFAVISEDKIVEQQVLGYKKINSDLKASVNDRFRLGSNTKLLTGYIAATLVKQNKIKWDTRFFDLFPELKPKSQAAYHDLTLLSLLSFRTKLIRWTYTADEPRPSSFNGGEEAQRLQFVKWVLAQKPIEAAGEVNFSNPAYVLAGLMLEKSSGQSYKHLVKDLGSELDIKFDFGPPNLYDSLQQPWGHDAELLPESPKENVKLSWLLPAGNINVSLPDFCKFIQLQLKGLAGKEKVLSKPEFVFLFEGLPGYSIGWFSATDGNNNPYAYHIGNPGTFLSKVYLYRDKGKAFILFSNCQSDAADRGLDVLYTELRKRYLR
ncbi:MAG: serine hydrolase domain-containing protein [Bacteroidota bacterium]